MKVFPTFQSMADSLAADKRWCMQIASAQIVATDTSMGQGARTQRVSGFLHGTANTHVHVEIDVIPTTMGNPIVISEAPPRPTRGGLG